MKSIKTIIKLETLLAVYRVISKQDFVFGEDVFRFEQEIENYFGSQYAVGVGSGTDAIFYTLKALGIGPGDEVITTPYGCVPPVEAIINSGAKPVFVDLRQNSFLFDERLIEDKISSRTKAILLTYVFGEASDLSAIMGISRKHGIHVIEDIAQAFGVKFKHTYVGKFGIAACLSFHPGKPLGGMGEGGMVVTDEKNLARRVKNLANHGSEVFYVNHTHVGGNSRLDTIQAAGLMVKLKYLESLLSRHREIAMYYSKKLENLPLIYPTSYLDEPYRHIYFKYVIQMSGAGQLVQFLNKYNIPAYQPYPVPLYSQVAYNFLGYKETLFPHTEEIVSKSVALPISPFLSNLYIEKTANLVLSFFKKNI